MPTGGGGGTKGVRGGDSVCVRGVGRGARGDEMQGWEMLKGEDHHRAVKRHSITGNREGDTWWGWCWGVICHECFTDRIKMHAASWDLNYRDKLEGDQRRQIAGARFELHHLTSVQGGQRGWRQRCEHYKKEILGSVSGRR